MFPHNNIIFYFFPVRFGSKRRGMRTGIIFNNQMSDFSQPHDVDAWGLPPAEANFIAPGMLFASDSGKVARYTYQYCMNRKEH